MNSGVSNGQIGKMNERSEWRAGGTMLTASMICYCFSVFPVMVLGALIKPIESEFGWSRAAITSAILINSAGTIFIGPLGGYVIDRIGPRRMALVGLLALSMATALIGLAGPSTSSWYAAWAVFAVAQAFAGNIMWTKAVVSRFDQNRGMALAIMLSGGALAYGLLPSFAVRILSVWNWPAIYFILATLTLFVGWPLAWRYFYGARDLERREAKVEKLPLPQLATAGVFPEALRTRQFWQMALSFFVIASAVSALQVHFQPILIDAGFSSEDAAAVAFVFGPAAILGRFGGGYLLDRFPANRVVALSVTLPAISYAILVFGGMSLSAVCVCAALLGIVLGAEADFMAYLASRYFGQQAFGSLYGLLLGIFAVGYGAAPVVTGRVFDVTNSYESSFVVLAFAALGGAVLIAKLGPVARSP